MTNLTIGQIAKQVNVSNDTIRLYERQGLIEEPSRATNGYRQFPENTIHRLEFILRAKEMGFTLKEISELLSISQSSKKNCRIIKQQIDSKLEIVKNKISELKKLERALTKLVQSCEKQTLTGTCPILSVLEKKGTKRR